MIKKITGKQLKHWAEWLKKEDCGCCHIKIVTDDKNREWCIAMGWLDGFDKNDNGKYQSGTWNICCEVGYHDAKNIMFSDLSWDLTMPYDEDTAEVDDTTTVLYDEPNWDKLADELNEEAERVINQWAYFEIEEEEIV